MPQAPIAINRGLSPFIYSPTPAGETNGMQSFRVQNTAGRELVSPREWSVREFFPIQSGQAPKTQLLDFWTWQFQDLELLAS